MSVTHKFPEEQKDHYPAGQSPPIRTPAQPAVKKPWERPAPVPEETPDPGDAAVDNSDEFGVS